MITKVKEILIAIAIVVGILGIALICTFNIPDRDTFIIDKPNEAQMQMLMAGDKDLGISFISIEDATECSSRVILDVKLIWGDTGGSYDEFFKNVGLKYYFARRNT